MARDANNGYPDRFWEYESQRESEEDLPELDGDSIRQAVVGGTDWTTETIIGQIMKGNIQLSPEFQRRDAWRGPRKSKFIESVILGLPIPQIVLAESKSQRGSYIVLDGKQRLLSLCQFAAEPEGDAFEQLTLERLEIRHDLNGMTLSKMKKDLARADDVAAFENQPIRTVVIKNWPSESFLYHVFLRLNTNSVALSPQELRQALHPGPFVQFVEEVSRDNATLAAILGRPGPDFRMRDAELLVRYYAFRNFITAYRGTLKAFLDQSCQVLNEEWDDRKAGLEAQLSDFDRIHADASVVFGENLYRKWSEDGFESRFNRAIFDIVMFAFEDVDRARTLVDHADVVVDTFKTLCSQDADFLASIEKTTKSLKATADRYGTWAQALNRAVGLDLPVLKLIGKQLTF
ncbi:MAG: GmrSD restriction endonuclease domain-containing protein [Coriobacteriia bacterium]